MDPQPSPNPLLYADQHHGGEPVCLPCFLRHQTESPDAARREEWAKIQASISAQWQAMPEERREKLGVNHPLGWVQLILNSQKWPRANGRCWDCVRQLVVSYRMLVEEVEGAEEFEALCESLQKAADDANRLALEMEASNYHPNSLGLQDGLWAGALSELATTYVASIQAALAERQHASSQSLLCRLRPQVRALLSLVKDERCGPDEARYEPLQVTPDKLRAVAVVLRQSAVLRFVTQHNFAAVLRQHAKDPHNLPERLALVVAYQWGQQMQPRMGYAELAQALVKWEAVPTMWRGGNVGYLAENIRKAVQKYRSLGPIPITNYAPLEGGTTPPQKYRGAVR